MKKRLVSLFLLFVCICLQAQLPIDTVLPVRGLAIAAPKPDRLDDFIKFIERELAPAHFNLLVLRVDFNYNYKSHPELKEDNPLTEQDVKQLVSVCRRNGIQLVPQINLLGHQSWAFRTGNLLRVYPEFDETPWIKMDEHREGEEFDFQNDERLYCKSYCPLHPQVHRIVFALVDEIMDVFEATSFHAGMDEVFFLGEDKCPRCSGYDKAELYAGEVNKIRNHLAVKDRKLMIWGDRLIDGKTTGIGAWDASMNQTARAIDLIAKDVYICDWHYDTAEVTPVLFALKGFNVVSCPWNKAQVAEMQIRDMVRFRNHWNKSVTSRYQGILHTVWSGAGHFLEAYYNPENATKEVSDVACLRYVMNQFKTLNK